MSEYEIDHNIPIPDKASKSNGKWHALAKEMSVGDSVEVNGRLEAMNLRNAIHNLGFKAVTSGNDLPKTRVWKVNKP